MRRTYQVHSTTNQVILHTRTILSSAATNKNHTVLLDIVTYTKSAFHSFLSYLPPTPTKPQGKKKKKIHTLTRNVSRNNLATTQPNSRRLPLPRVRLLRLRNTSLQANALHLRPVHQRRRPRSPRALRNSASTTDLVACGLAERGGGELAAEKGGGACWCCCWCSCCC